MDLYADLPLAKGTNAGLCNPSSEVPTQRSIKRVNPAPTPSLLPPIVQAKKSIQSANSESNKNAYTPSVNASTSEFKQSNFAIANFKPMSIIRKSGVPNKPAKPVLKKTTQSTEPVANKDALFSTFFQPQDQDEYDPARPNSYEILCEQRLQKKRLDRMKRDLERRQRVQDEEARKEREKVVRDVEEGKVLSVSAGRGKGLTLPAWMKKKITEEPSAEGSEIAMDDPCPDQFSDAQDVLLPSDSLVSDSEMMEGRSKRSTSDAGMLESQHAGKMKIRNVGQSARVKEMVKKAHSRVILLQNMVLPAQVDDQLREEVKEECTVKYGKVRNCVLYEVPNAKRVEDAVRIFVEFDNGNVAEKALLGLNGRYFGGRKVSASFYDELKFQKFDLSL